MTESRFVFLVMGSVDHYGSEPVRAFLDEPEAKSFAATCHAYQQTIAPLPGIDDGDDEWRIALAAQTEWRSKHPAGESHYDSFYVYEIPFSGNDAATEKEAVWVRRKLGLPEDSDFGAVQGALHVVCGDAHGMQTYIKAFKCNDKQGEIARLTVERNQLRNALQELVDWQNGPPLLGPKWEPGWNNAMRLAREALNEH